MFGSSLILLATIGQPGATAPPKEWIVTTDPRTGQATRILGWRDPSGRAMFNPAEYPWLKPATPPAPAKEPEPGPPFPPNGVVAEKMPKIEAGVEWYGGNITPTVAVGPDAAEEDEKPPDGFITVIGGKPQRDAVRAEFERSAEFRAMQERMGDRLAVHYYDPTNPMVAKVGLPDGGRPDIVLQDASGGEVRRWHDDPGADVVAGEALRLLDPAYRPGGKIIHKVEEWTVSGAAVLIGLSVGLVVGAAIVCASWAGRSR